MPSSQHNKALAICRVINILKARIKYNTELLCEIENYNHEDFLEFGVKNFCLDSRNKDSLSHEHITESKRVLLSYTSNDIERLKELLKNAESQNNPVLAYYIMLRLCIEQHQADRLQKESQDYGLSSKQASIASNSDKQEYSTYKDIKNILYDNYFDLCEQEFISTYSEFRIINNYKYLILTPQFSQLLKRQNETIEKCRSNLSKLSKLSNFHIKSIEEFSYEIDKCEVLMQESFEYMKMQDKCLDTTQVPHQQLLIMAYQCAYKIKTPLTQITTKIKSLLEEEQKWQTEQKQQQIIAEQNAAREEKQRKVESERAAKAAKKKADIEDKTAKLALEQACIQKELEQKKLLEIKQKEDALRKQELLDKRLLATNEWKLKVANERAAKELQENDEKNKFNESFSKNKTEYDDNGIVKSNFKLPVSVIESHAEEIRDLLSCTAISYRRAVTLIKSLGGKIDISTGSSHQKIIFNNTLYQYINGSAEAKLVAGLYRPHDGETRLMRFELELLKNVVRAIIPVELLHELDNKPKIRPTLSV